jgi:Mn-dependent DtxR family transcriptional regulator
MFCKPKFVMAQKKASVSEEDYLERIYELIQSKGYARAVDIAEALGTSQSSVTSMVQRMAKGGLVNYEKYRGLTLTAAGKTVAEKIQIRHKILIRFLSLIGVSQKTQERDIEGLEHHLSAETIEALKNLTMFLEKQEEILLQLQTTGKREQAGKQGMGVGTN